MSLLTQLQIRRDTATNWATVNPVLAVGELGLETDTGHLRAGDGSSVWTQLTTAFKRVNPRTAPQLAAAPTSTDIALGAGALFVGPDNLLRYINAGGSAFVTIDIAAMVSATTSAANAASSAAGVASAAQAAAAAAVPLTQKGAASGVATLGSDSKVPTSQMTGKLATTDLTDVATAITAALAAKQNIPIFWNGTTPALVSSTNPVPSFGSNAFLYTGAGGAVLDGNTFQTGDLALWNGTVFMKEIFGGGYLGTFASTAALQTAYPAASNPACIALVVGVIYISNGTAWQVKVQASTDLSDSASLERLVGTFASTSALQTAFPAASNTGYKALVGASAPYTNYSSNGSAWVKGVSASTDLSDAASLVSAASLTTGTLPVGRLPAFSGDVTTSAGGAATTLSSSAPALLQQPINFQTGTTYTLALTDAGNAVDMANASANTLTIPPNSSVAFPLYTVITVSQGGAGTTTIAPGAGVTINKPTARTLAISAQYETALLQKVGTDTWRALVG